MPSRLCALRRQAFHRQCRRCYYCGVTMWLLSPDELPGGSPSAAAADRLRCTAEHLVPKSEGGPDTVSNIVAACAHCNHTRHRRPRPLLPADYRHLVARRVSRGAWHPAWVFQQGLLPRTPGLAPAPTRR
ncbi:MAG: HNH endonuclease [Burkholderiaceae bacterium]|nr:HNH endonuclease [Burkholderiaceae bacterium]